MTDGEVLHWVEEHVAEIRMLPADPFDKARFTVAWIDRNGHRRANERCKNLRELAEQHS